MSHHRITIAFIVSVGCQGGEPEQTRGNQQEIRGGAPSNCYPQVVQLTSPGGDLCTGTVIGPGLILTAAHCITVPAGGGSPMATVTGLGGTAQITDAYINPAYNRCDTGANRDLDMAVVRFTGTVMPAGVHPAQVGTPTVGTVYQTIGYGLPNYGERRQGAFRVDAVAADGTLDVSSTNAASCGGDSGSPLLSTPKGGCDGTPPPTVVATHTASFCELNQPSQASSTVASSDFIEAVRNGTAVPFDTTTMADCCTPAGSTRACTGAGGCAGTETCQADLSWSDCACDPGPCEGNPDPCCGSGDPCCGSSDPCCGSTDPCCGSWDECCGSTDPCCGSNDECCGSSDPCCGVYCVDPYWCEGGSCVFTDVTIEDEL